MGFFEQMTMDVTHFKSGWQGPTGSGKTTTAALVAIGLHRYLKLKTPVAFFDTERGAGFVQPLFRTAGIELVGKRSRAFKDLCEFIRTAEREQIDIVLIDSITHPWRELLQAFKTAKKRDFIALPDWAPLKERWHDGYALPFVNSKLHIFMCGRQANVFEDVEDDTTTPGGKKRYKPVKIGTKMATEADTGYEPNFLVEMSKVLQGTGKYARVATCLKDRSFQLDGSEQVFEMPMKKGRADVERLLDENVPFNWVRPHIEMLDLKGSHAGVSAESSSGEFDDAGQSERRQQMQKRELALEDILETLQKYWPGQEKTNKKARGDLVEGISWFWGQKTRNWRMIESKWDFQMVDKLHRTLVMLIEKRMSPLQEALSLGVDEKGKVLNADAAPEGVKSLVDDLFDSMDETETEDDLPI